jgi:hypothetical protein
MTIPNEIRAELATIADAMRRPVMPANLSEKAQLQWLSNFVNDRRSEQQIKMRKIGKSRGTRMPSKAS